MINTVPARRRRLPRIALPAVLGIVAPAIVLWTMPAGATTTVVEPFDGPLNFSTSASSEGTTSDHAGSLGGELDVFVERLNGTAAVTAQNAGGTLFHGNGPGPFSISRLTLAWDGNDDAAGTLDPTGLRTGGAGVDLTAAGGDAFQLSGLSVDLQGSFVLSVFTDATHASTRAFSLTPSQPTPTLLIPFSSFATATGAAGPADFGDVGAISLALTGGNFGLDFTINDVSVVPEPVALPVALAALLAFAPGCRRPRRH